MNRTQPGSEYDPESENGIDDIEYPYRCDSCGRGFLTPTAHNAHQRVHADDDILVASDGGEILTEDTP